MKPPPRKRRKPDRTLYPDPGRSPSKAWQRGEQKNLLRALKALGSNRGGLEDVDCDYLRKEVPSRSISEISSVVEYLKDKVITTANSKLMTRMWEERKARKPIEVWTHMASVIAGTQAEPISAAFSQLLIVSSTEPCTLKNCDPPQVHRPATDWPAGRTVPLRPMPRSPVKVESPGTDPARPVRAPKTPGPTKGLRVSKSKTPSAQKQVSTTAGTLPGTNTTTSQSASTNTTTTTTTCQPGAAETLSEPAPSPQPASQTGTPVTDQVSPSSDSATMVQTQSDGDSLIQTTQQPSEQHPTTTTTSTSTSKSTSSGSHTSSPSSTPVPSTAASPGASSSARPTPPLSTPAAACHAKFGRTSKHATKDSPRLFGTKSIVDFEKIYRFLGAVQEPNEERCNLTPMESAIVLDLLMSLPEELPLLDYNNLHKHMIKMHRFLSSTADAKTVGAKFKQLKDELYPQAEAPSGPDAAGSADRRDAAGAGGGKDLQPGEAERQSSDQSGDVDVSGLCPHLNPFMVPLKLLMRK